jgi:DNA-binding CsgD family transcriptional regulator
MYGFSLPVRAPRVAAALAGPEMDPDELNDITSLVYEAALDPAMWPRVLGRLAGMVQGSHDGVWPPVGTGVPMKSDNQTGVSPPGLDDADGDDVFLNFWVQRNGPATGRPAPRAVGAATPPGLHEGLRLDLWAGDGWIEGVSNLRPSVVEPGTPDDGGVGRRLLPHLQRAAMVARRLRVTEGLAQAGLAALERVQTAMMLLDGQGRVMHGNAACLALLAAADGLSAHATRLAAATSGATSGLLELLHRAAGSGATAPESGTLRLPRPSGRPPLALVAMPLRRDGGPLGVDVPGVPAVLACIIDPLTVVNVDQGQLVSLFGLTQSEAALAVELLSGLELQEIAARSGRSIHTVRTQLAKVMSKTATRRQAELMLLLAGMPRAVAQ